MDPLLLDNAAFTKLVRDTAAQTLDPFLLETNSGTAAPPSTLGSWNPPPSPIVVTIRKPQTILGSTSVTFSATPRQQQVLQQVVTGRPAGVVSQRWWQQVRRHASHHRSPGVALRRPPHDSGDGAVPDASPRVAATPTIAKRLLHSRACKWETAGEAAEAGAFDAS